MVGAYFSKENFVNPLVNEGFTIISRLRDDADLKYIFEGEQKKGRGRPRKQEGKIDFKDLNLSKLKNVRTQRTRRNLHRNCFLKIIKNEYQFSNCKNKNKEKWTHKLYFSTDFNQDWKVILKLYKSRF